MGAAPLTPSWHAERTPDKPAIIMGATGETVSYAELEDRSSRLARALRGRGLEAGDAIAICMANNRAYLEVAWAAQRSGLRYTAIDPTLSAVRLQYVLDDSGARALVSTAGMAGLLGRLDLSVIGVLICADSRLPGFERYAEVLAATPQGRLAQEREGREMLYSVRPSADPGGADPGGADPGGSGPGGADPGGSGPGGWPTKVRRQLPRTAFGDPASAPVLAANAIAQYGAEDAVYLCPAPLHESAPLVWSMSLHRFGATVVLMEQFDARRCLELIERYRATHAHFVPAMYTRMLGLPAAERARYDTSSLRLVINGATPCPN